MSVFDRRPPLQNEALPLSQEMQSTDAIDTAAIKKGRTNRYLLRRIARLGIPFVAILVLIWILLPNQLALNKKQNNTVIETVDTKKQETQAKLLHEELSQKARSVAVNDTVQLPLPEAQDKKTSELSASKEHDNDVKSAALESPGTFHFIDDKNKAISHNDLRVSSLEQEKNERLAKKLHGYGLDTNKNLQWLAQAGTDLTKSDNERFLESHANNTVHVSTLQKASGEHVLLQGSVIRSVLLSGINSDLPGLVTAMVTANVYDSIYGQHIVIPKGSRLIGQYRSAVVIGQSRLLVAMQRLILPDGTWVSLSGTSATDAIGHSGLKAQVDNHFWEMFGSSFIIGAASLLLPKDKATITTQNLQGDGDLSAGTISGIALYEVIRELLERNRVIQPTLTVEPGTEFAFLVAQDFTMRPYRFK